uniref:Zinc metalloproteinase n=1 Tax=Plectus sambesii TaxID=2011161 RepID=A0A914VNM1_9BILA
MKTLIVLSIVVLCTIAPFVQGQDGLPSAVGKSNKTEAERKTKAIKAFRLKGRGARSDNDMAAGLEKVKSALKKRNIRAKAQLKADKKRDVEVKPNPKYDQREGTPDSFEVANADLLEYLLEGDIVIAPENVAALETGSNSTRKKRKTISNQLMKWPTAAEGYIPYLLDEGLSDDTPDKVPIVLEAMKFWEDNTCLNFEPAKATDIDGLYFVNAGGCWSSLGKQGGMQPVGIGYGCAFMAIAAHEIAHALGFYHEQSRYDRDSFVQINTQYIAAGMEQNFLKATVAEMSTFTTPYDYGSLMHYTSDSFTNNAAYPTITALDSAYQQAMGQRKGPSFYDVREMNEFYNCNALCASSTTVCQNGGYRDPRNCAKCKCPDGFGGQFCEALQAAENTANGTVLTATTTMQTLTATVGTSVFYDAIQTRYWHIKSAPGTAVEVTVTAVAGVCSKGCSWNFLELKMGRPVGVINGINVQSPFEGTGYRYCCAADNLNKALISTTNLVPVIAYGNDQLTFTIKYRQGKHRNYNNNNNYNNGGAYYNNNNNNEGTDYNNYDGGADNNDNNVSAYHNNYNDGADNDYNNGGADYNDYNGDADYSANDQDLLTH